MIRINFVIVLSVFSFVVSGQDKARQSVGYSNCELHPTLIDSLYTYNWDTINNRWEPSSIRHYESSEGRYDRLVFINPNTREFVRSWDYYYNESGNRNLELSSRWVGGDWIVNLRKVSEYNSRNKKINEVRHYFKNDNWNFVSSTYFVYAEDELAEVHFQENDDYGNLTDVSYYEYFYENGNLIEIVKYNGNSTLSGSERYIYNDETEKLSERIFFNFIENEVGKYIMVPSSRQLYYYDEFSLLSTIIFQERKGDSWETYSKSEIFYKLYTASKVVICHNNHTICVSVNAAKAHLSHGDSIGECSMGEEEHQRQSQRTRHMKDVAVIYPNPAKDRFTIKIGANECNIKRVQISDFYGRVLRDIQVVDQNEIVVYRQGLVSGKYTVTLIGDNIYDSFIIFK